ncbi:MAG: glycosyltransferase family 4 protein [Desulfitobacterium hafniense]|nr:glycosyltransferase family 4 protein [Desulfitobacterium hafniense]
MAVLSLTNEFGEEKFGGAGSSVTGMLHMLDRHGVRQTVVVPRTNLESPTQICTGRLTVLNLPRKGPCFGDLGLINVQVAIRDFPDLKRHWDMIHIHAINFAPLAYALAEGRIPILYSVYSFLRQELSNSSEPELQAQFAVQDELIDRCQKIHLISQSEKQYFAGSYPLRLDKTEVVPVGISLPLGSWQKGRSNRFLYVGRLLDYKGIEDLIKAVFYVKQTGRQIYLDIVGSGDPAYEARLKLLVQSMRLSSQVRFFGWISGSEVLQLMERAAALVVPSHRESFGLVALEGMAIGVPLIASKAGGLAELVDSSCALTFEPGSIQALSSRLSMAVDNPSILPGLARRARERALAFDWKRLAPRYLQLYQQVIGC